MGINVAWRAAFGHSDFEIYWVHTRGILYHNKDPLTHYFTDSVPPSFYCLYMAFFTPLNLFWASMFWYILQVILWGLSLLLLARIMEISVSPEKSADPSQLKGLPGVVTSSKALLMAPVLSVGLLVDNLSLGQNYLLILFLLTSAFYLFLRHRPFWAGFLVALATSLKVTPGLSLAYFLFKREFRVLLGALVGLMVFMLLVPSFFYGFDRNLHLLRNWGNAVLLPFFTGRPLKTATVSWHSANQSLDAFLFRHFTPYGRLHNGGLHRWLDRIMVDPPVLKRISLLWKGLILLTIILLTCRSLGQNRSLFPLEFSLVILAMMFISPVAWISHYMLVLFPYFVAVDYITRAKGRERNILKWGLAVAVVLCNINVTRHIQSYSGIFIGHFIFWVALALVLFLENRRWRSQAHLAGDFPSGESPPELVGNKPTTRCPYHENVHHHSRL